MATVGACVYIHDMHIACILMSISGVLVLDIEWQIGDSWLAACTLSHVYSICQLSGLQCSHFNPLPTNDSYMHHELP